MSTWQPCNLFHTAPSDPDFDYTKYFNTPALPFSIKIHFIWTPEPVQKRKNLLCKPLT